MGWLLVLRSACCCQVAPDFAGAHSPANRQVPIAGLACRPGSQGGEAGRIFGSQVIEVGAIQRDVAKQCPACCQLDDVATRRVVVIVAIIAVVVVAVWAWCA